MLRGYRCAFLAAVGLLGAASQPEQDARKQKGESTTKVAHSAPSPASAPSIKSVDASKYKPPCREPQSPDRCDLEAQWKAADAADKAAWWAVVQAILSAAGIVGLVASLYYTRKAVLGAEASAQDAKDALAIASRNADAAAHQAETARDTARRDLRAYVLVSTGKSVVQPNQGAEGAAVDVTIEITNYGRTPADALRVSAAISWGNHLHPDFFPVPESYSPTYPKRSLAPSEAIFQKYYATASSEDIDSLRNARSKIWITGRITYKDIFGEIHDMELRLVSDLYGIMRPAAFDAERGMPPKMGDPYAQYRKE